MEGSQLGSYHSRSTVSVNNASVRIQNVLVLNSHLLLFLIGDNSSVINATIFNGNYALVYSGSHIFSSGIRVYNGDVNLVNNSNHIGLYDVIVLTATRNFIYAIGNGHHITLCSVLVKYGAILLQNNGDYLTLCSIKVIGKWIDVAHSNEGGLILINNGNHILLDIIKIVKKSLSLGRNGNDLIVTNVDITGNCCQNFTLNKNGNHIRLSNVTVTLENGYGIMLLKRNGGNISISNITLYQKLNTSSYDAYTELVLRYNSDYISLECINVTGDVDVSFNGNNISIIHVSIVGIRETNGLLMQRNKNNITLSDITVLRNGGIYADYNGDYLTMKNHISVADEFIFLKYNGNHMAVLNVTLIGTTLALLYNGDDLLLANVLISHCFSGLVMKYNRKLIRMDNVTLSNNKNGMIVEGDNELWFVNNPSHMIDNTSPTNGAGMFIKDVSVYSDTEVYFINNTALGVGGAVYVNIVQLETSIEARCTFDNFRPVFVNNIAYVAGNNIYNGKYWNCRDSRGYNNTVYVYTLKKLVNCSGVQYLRTFPHEHPLSFYITSTSIGVCICTNDNKIDCTSRRVYKQLYPGQSITLPLVTVGMCGGLSPGVLLTLNTSTVEVLLNTNCNQQTKRECSNFTYHLRQRTRNRHGSFFINNTLNGPEKSNTVSDSGLLVDVLFRPCPVGLELKDKTCQCNRVLSSSSFTECNINSMPYPIKRSGNNWLYYNHDYNCTVAHRYCPLGYCNSSSLSLSLVEGDAQCSHGRSGILCGKCEAGLSLMLGSNKCGPCSNKYLGTLAGFIAAGIILLVFLLFLNLTVSVGSINGLLFYANVVKLNETVYFPNGSKVPLLSQFIAWINLDLGIETCFFNGLDGYWKTWLQFVFPLYIWLLIGIVITSSHYSGKVSRLCGNNAVPVLATLILMSYSKLLQAITNVLMIATIDCEGIVTWKVWSVDGNIGYLSGKHIPLFAVALLFLFAGLVYTGLVFSGQWLQRYSGKCCKSSRDPVVKLKPFIDAYTGPYKNEYRFWTGLFLIVRLAITPIFSYTTSAIPQANNYIISFFTFFGAYLSKGVYRNRAVNGLETFYCINLGLLSMFSIFSAHMGYSAEVTGGITTVSVSLSFIAFIGTVMAHAYVKSIQKSCQLCVSSCKIFLFRQKVIESNAGNLNEALISNASYSPSHVVMKRDSIIFDFGPVFEQ
uniref:Right handed beta helix domain-containing protein n=1 Tax=Amphimedon queenslandica TaxID=400682 RepID=A0A1X7VN55_AMPQE